MTGLFDDGPLAPAPTPPGLPGVLLTSRFWLDAAADIVRQHAHAFAKYRPAARAALLREMIPLTAAVAEDWVRAGCAAKSIAFDAPIAGEEWLAGPAVVVRNLRLLAESWEKIAAGLAPHHGVPMRSRKDGLAEADVFPASGLDAALFAGFRCTVLLDPPDSEEPQSGPDCPEGGATVLVLGAGNVSSIPAMDVLHKMFVEGRTCVLKMNPVNEWAGPFIEKAFKPLIDRGFLRVVYGGGDVGEYLCAHRSIDEIHITGSDRTHDLIVWGPPGPERDRRKAENDPVNARRITSELGNISPVAIVPGEYSEKELWFMARNVAAMVANNASFNCNAAKMLVTAKGWPQRKRFLEHLVTALMRIPTRQAYYPGAHERFAALTSGSRKRVRCLGGKATGELPWALVTDLDPSDRSEKLFSVEPFCSILGETQIASPDPVDFLETMTLFCNERLWGTLNASIMISPRTERQPDAAAALERAIVQLRYGTVAINHWPALGYGLVSPPWGGHPSATLADVRSGIGWVHNTFMLRGVQKSIIRGPLVVSPKPAWFQDNAMSHVVGRKLVAFEASPSWGKVPGVAFAAMRG
jgi:hypothetical protein